MTVDPSLTQAITVLGAAGVALWVIRLLTSSPPSLHTHSEVVGLQADKAQLFAANQSMQKTLEEVIALLHEILKLLQARGGDE